MSAPATKLGLSDRQLYETVHHRMRSLAGAAAPDLDDLIQVAAEQVFGSLDRFDGRCAPSTWVYSICYRVLLTQHRWYRRFRVRFTPLEPSDDFSAEGPSAPELLEARARSQMLHRVLGRMTDKYRAVVVLHDLEELEIGEIAAIVGANELTVRSRLRDGRKQLTRLMNAEETQTHGAAHEPTAY